MFEYILHKNRSGSSMEERLPSKQEVTGSTPVRITKQKNMGRRFLKVIVGLVTVLTLPLVAAVHLVVYVISGHSILDRIADFIHD